MKHLLACTAVFALANVALATTQSSHPGLPPSSAGTTEQSSVYSDIYSRGTTINTKYGTAMTADELKASADQRRADMKMINEGAPHTGDAEGSSTTPTY